MRNKVITKLTVILLLTAILSGCAAPKNGGAANSTAGFETSTQANAAAGTETGTQANAVAGTEPSTQNAQASTTAGTDAAADESSKTAATLGELADFFIQAADDYRSDKQHNDRSAVMEGFNASDKATRLQMLVLAGRAFGPLPEPVGNAKKMAPGDVDLSDVPEWARTELQNLNDSGILAASDLNRETNGQTTNIMDTPADMKDAKIIAARLFAVKGTNLKDDFFATVNKKSMEGLEIPEGDETVGGSSAVTARTDKQLADLIDEIVNSSADYPVGSAEQKIRDLYKNYEDKQARNAAGIKPLQKYLDAVDKAENFSQLNEAIAQAVNALGNFANGLFAGIPVVDTKDSSRKVLQLMTMGPSLMPGDYDDPEGESYTTYKNSMIEQLMTTGESRENAEKHAEAILRLEKDLAGHMRDWSDSSELPESKYYTQKLLDEMMPQANVSQLLTAIGLKSDVKMIVFDDQQFEAYAKWFTEENLEIFKAIEKISLLSSYSSYLSEELAEKFGNNDIPSGDIAVQNFLSEELGQLYVSRYFPEESKAEIEQMVKMMIETYKARIQRLDWMEESTKAEAIKKLDAMNVLIGYPDEWNFNKAVILSGSDGGSFFDNVAASEVEKWKNQLEELDKPVDKRRFVLAAYTVNAAANRSTNTILFPAGILQAPFYDKNASFETNLGAIGSTIAHEITHIFDDGGAQFDAQGNMRNWWGDEDYDHFKALCTKAAAFYDGQEAVVGATVNGADTLSENISDIGGIACGLEILSGMDNPDYDAFFRSYASQWLRIGSYDTLAELAITDMHAPNNLRCNRVLANFQEFYDTYDIQPGDGMYVAPEDRIKIW